MIAEHKIQFKYSGLTCSCGWTCDFYGVDLLDDVRKAILIHVDDFMKCGEYIKLTPGSTWVIYKLKSLCTEEEIKWNEQWEK